LLDCWLRVSLKCKNKKEATVFFKLFIGLEIEKNYLVIVEIFNLAFEFGILPYFNSHIINLFGEER